MRCSRCGYRAEHALTQCPSCGDWGTFSAFARASQVQSQRPVERLVASQPALNELVGGGWVRGYVYRLAAAPGAGKSTLALDLGLDHGAVYFCGEELVESVAERARRISRGRPTDGLYLAPVAHVEDLGVELPGDVSVVIVDSAHVLSSRRAGAPGSNAALEHLGEVLQRMAQERRVVVLCIAHVNKDGAVKGTTAFDHRADCLLDMETRDQNAGVIQCSKNRAGATKSISYRHTEEGLTYE